MQRSKKQFTHLKIWNEIHMHNPVHVKKKLVYMFMYVCKCIKWKLKKYTPTSDISYFWKEDWERKGVVNKALHIFFAYFYTVTRHRRDGRFVMAMTWVPSECLVLVGPSHTLADLGCNCGSLMRKWVCQVTCPKLYLVLLYAYIFFK